uniref:hypothetical protein n=1 Tax=Leifsonia aquatica TaxID=144185 RepID=UPI000468C9EA
SIGFDGPVTVRYTDANRVTERIVSVRAVPVKDHHGQPTGEVDIDMIARDPRRYSVGDSWVRADPPSQSAGLVWPAVWPAKWPGGGGSDGRVTLTNLGKKGSDPVYRVAGGFDAFTLVNVADQRQVGFQAPFSVPVGSVVEVDFAARTAFMDGTADVTRWLFPRQWWTVPREASVTCQLAVTAPVGSPFYEGRVRSAW